MKKLIVIFLLLIPLLVQAQFLQLTTFEEKVIVVPARPAATITWSEVFYTEKPWSVHFDYRYFDSTNAILGVYGSNFDIDSAVYELFWFDGDMDGTNDNPKTLSDSTWVIYGDSFPFWYIIYYLQIDSVSSGLPLFYNKVRAKKLGF